MSSSAPKVSVIMPVINGAEYLNVALDSVLAQDFDDFEVICVNDGSTDGTLALLASFDDPRIRIISQVSQGGAAARNTGIYFARGQYIALIDWHDRWLKNKLSSHIAHLDSSARVGASYSPSLFIDKQGQLTGLGQFPRLYDIGLREVVCHNLIGNGSAAVIRRATLNKLNACSPVHESGRICYFDETLRDAVKLDFWLKIALYSGLRVEGVSIPTTHVRDTAGKLPVSLAEQYASWLDVMAKYRSSHPARVNRWFSLAHAYQLRRLALNASQTGETRLAFAYFFKAVFTNWRMVAETPGTTLIVAASVCLSVLPRRYYRFFEARATKRLAKKQLAV
ncbi:glycosyltransferase family A protein [Salinimonas iocasae]|nr:glycosyltransferase family A protein [Salinimonas iocasae]